MSVCAARASVQYHILPPRPCRPRARLIYAITAATEAPTPPSKADATGKRRAVVIGAGFAGLSAARTLQQSGGWEVVVLEASDRVGGRAWSINAGGHTSVELGATWIHGIGGGNPIYRHALEFGLLEEQLLPEKSEYWTPTMLRSGGRGPLQGGQLAAAQAAAFAFSEGIKAASERVEGCAADVLNSCWRELLQREAGGWDAGQLEAAAGSWQWSELLQRAIEGSPSSQDLGCVSLHEYEDFPGPHVCIPHGFQAVAEGLAQGLDIRFDHAVSCVTYGRGSRRRQHQQQQRQRQQRHRTGEGGEGDKGDRSSGRSCSCTVTCTEAGVSFEADAVVVSVSVGVLKAQHKSMFDPPLSARKAAAIAAVGLGVVNKVLVEFEPDTSLQPGAATTPGAAAAARDQQEQEEQKELAFVFGTAAAVGDQQQQQQEAQEKLSAALGAPAVVGDHLQQQQQEEQEELAVAPNGGFPGLTPAGFALLPDVDACAGPPFATRRAQAEAGEGEGVRAPAEQGKAMAGQGAVPAVQGGVVVATSGAERQEDSLLGKGVGLGFQHQPWQPDPTGVDWTEGVYALHFGGHGFLRHPRPLLAAAAGAAPGAGAAVEHAAQPSTEGPSQEGLDGRQRVSISSNGGGSIATASGGGGTQRISTSSHGNGNSATAPGSSPKAMLWVSGVHALALEAQPDDGAVAEGITRLLARFPAAVPRGWPEGQPLRTLRVWRSSWGGDQRFLGSYSFLPPGTGPGNVRDLAAPLMEDEGSAASAASAASGGDGSDNGSNPSVVGGLEEGIAASAALSEGNGSNNGSADGGLPLVVFCGEATHETYFGTTHGAYLSGQREARRLLDAYGGG